MTFLTKTFFKLNLLCHSRKLFDYAVREPHLPPAATGLHKHVSLSGSESWASLHKLVYVCVCVWVSEWVCLHKEQDEIWKGCCEDVVSMNEWMNEYGVRQTVNMNKQIHFDCFPFASSSPECLSLRVFVVGKFIWVPVKLIVKHSHNGPILLRHIQQWAFLWVCHTLWERHTHTNIRFDDWTDIYMRKHCLTSC